MRHLFATVILGLIVSGCFAQEFLHSADYLYGMGTTDSEAVTALSVSIGVTIENDIRYTVIENDDRISSSYVRNTGLSSSRFVKETMQYYSDGIYYRYLNKKEFISSCISLCDEYERKAEEYAGARVKHSQNLVLGYYYKAYSAIDDPVFRILTNDGYEPRKSSIFSKASSVYQSGEYGHLFLNEKGIGGYWVVTNRGSRSVPSLGESGLGLCLFAFETRYEHDRTWHMPKYYQLHFENRNGYTSTPDDGITYDRAFVHSRTNRIVYRLIYEDEFGKIDVPDEWYFANYYVINTRNLD